MSIQSSKVLTIIIGWRKNSVLYVFHAYVNLIQSIAIVKKVIISSYDYLPNAVSGYQANVPPIIILLPCHEGGHTIPSLNTLL